MENPSHCKKCEAQLPKYSNFCTKCGKPFDAPIEGTPPMNGKYRNNKVE